MEIYNKNWYRTAKILDQMDKEAGLGKSAMLFVYAAALFLMGLSIANISKKTNLSETEVQQAIADTNNKEQAKQVIQSGDFKTLMQNLEFQSQENAKLFKEVDKTKQMEKQLADLNKKYPDQQIGKNHKDIHEIANEERRKQYQIDIVARTIYAEAQGESSVGKHAVASVIYNRAGGNPEKMEGVVTASDKAGKYHAFSCWNSGTPSQGKGSAWEESVKLAKQMFSGSFSPSIHSKFYYNPRKANPSWAYVNDNRRKPRKPFKDIGNHRFLM
jgi:spore germination cell wall hydrolase CwlJ-like protein